MCPRILWQSSSLQKKERCNCRAFMSRKYSTIKREKQKKNKNKKRNNKYLANQLRKFSQKISSYLKCFPRSILRRTRTRIMRRNFKRLKIKLYNFLLREKPRWRNKVIKEREECLQGDKETLRKSSWLVFLIWLFFFRILPSIESLLIYSKQT